MSRICRNMGDSQKLRFYELDHVSKMRLLKTHPHTSNGLATEPGTRSEKQLKETKTLKQGKLPLENLPRTAGVAGGGAKKALQQTSHRKFTRAKQAFRGRTLTVVHHPLIPLRAHLQRHIKPFL